MQNLRLLWSWPLVCCAARPVRLTIDYARIKQYVVLPLTLPPNREQQRNTSCAPASGTLLLALRVGLHDCAMIRNRGRPTDTCVCSQN